MVSHRLAGLLSSLLVFAGCAQPVREEPSSSSPSERDQLLSALEEGQPRTILIVERESNLAVSTVKPRDAIYALVPTADRLFAGDNLPILSVIARSREQLEALEALPEVLSLEPERFHDTDAAAHLELIGQPAALAQGADGRGTSIAVLDSGVDYARAAFGSCTAPGAGCAVAFARDFAPDDGARDTGDFHGTNVAGIVRLVAPSADILALDVATGVSASSTHITAALDWVIANRDTYHIAAVNLSLGYGAFSAPCPTDVLAVALQRVRDAGIVPVVSTGNSGYLNAIGSPACAPAAVSVGAVDSSGTVAPFSNSASFVSILAPGVTIAAGDVTMTGTSHAAPHIAGAVAAVHSAYPADNASDTVARLVGTGVTTLDPRNGVSTPRLALGAAVAGGVTAPPPDVAPPTGTLTLAGPFVRSAAVPFTIDATDASPIVSMCLSAGTSCTTFVPFSTSGTFTVPGGNGLKTVRAWLKDQRGNVSSTPLTATTTLDVSPPTAGTVTVTPGVAALTLVTSGATDVGSGIERFVVVVSSGATSPANCVSGTKVADTTSTSFTFSGLTNGTVYRYRVCAVDKAGNMSTGATGTGSPRGELVPPSSPSISIADGATWTRTAAVSVSLAASDESGVTAVCLSTTPASCTAFVPFTSRLTTNLSPGTGARSVYAWFRDRWGNGTASPVSDSILLDASPPPSPVVSVTRLDGALELSWPAVNDAAGGIGGVSYRVRGVEGTSAPTNCTGGTVVGASPHRATGLTNGRAYSFRVCAVDALENSSSGSTVAAVPAPETDAPTNGSVVIADGAAWTSSTTVSLSLAATDPGGVTLMCVAVTATCTRWVPFATSTSILLPAGSGTRTVNAWFRDAYGNAMVSPVKDTISIDTAAPSNPRVTAVAESGAVAMTFTASADAAGGSGVAGYLVATSVSGTTPTCGGGLGISASAPRSHRVVATSGTTVRWRVCAVDQLGNVSSGQTGATRAL